jgi:uncharacterized protein
MTELYSFSFIFMNPLYAFTVPVFIKLLGGLTKVIEKAEAHGVDEKALLSDALAPDMFPFVKQVQVACDNAKGATARLAGMEVPSFPDTEASFGELKERIQKTIEFISAVPESAFADAAERKIVLPYFPDKWMSGFDYAREYAIPNFIFHVTTAYGLVRKAGVAVGKGDFINGLPKLNPIE